MLDGTTSRRRHPLIQGYVSLIGWSYLSEWRTDDRVGEAQMRKSGRRMWMISFSRG